MWDKISKSFRFVFVGILRSVVDHYWLLSIFGVSILLVAFFYHRFGSPFIPIDLIFGPVSSWVAILLWALVFTAFAFVMFSIIPLVSAQAVSTDQASTYDLRTYSSEKRVLAIIIGTNLIMSLYLGMVVITDLLEGLANINPGQGRFWNGALKEDLEFLKQIVDFTNAATALMMQVGAFYLTYALGKGQAENALDDTPGDSLSAVLDQGEVRRRNSAIFAVFALNLGLSLILFSVYLYLVNAGVKTHHWPE